MTGLIQRRVRRLCERIADGIELRATKLDGPARAAMFEIAAAVREAAPK